MLDLLRIQARNLDLSADVEEYLRKRLQRVARRLQGIRVLEAVVVFTREETRQADQRIVGELTMNLNGTLVRAEERGPDLRTVIDSLADVLARRVAQYKGRTYRSEQARKAGRRESIRYAESVPPPSEEEEEEEVEPFPAGRVVRVKRFAVKPMSVEEAVEEMELLGHDFFLFQDAETGGFRVVYRRRDGNYGVIVPET